MHGWALPKNRIPAVALRKFFFSIEIRKSKIDISNHTCEAYRSDVYPPVIWRMRLYIGQTRHYFVDMPVEPSGPTQTGRTRHPLIAGNQSGREYTVAHGLLRQRSPARRRVFREYPPACNFVEIFANDSTVVQRRPIIQNQRRNLSKGIEVKDFLVPLIGTHMCVDKLKRTRQTEFMRDNNHF